MLKRTRPAESNYERNVFFRGRSETEEREEL